VPRQQTRIHEGRKRNGARLDIGAEQATRLRKRQRETGCFEVLLTDSAHEVDRKALLGNAHDGLS
jgi:hypothetical protein